MLGAASKTFFHLLARSRFLETAATRYGMASETSFARRFIAGETIEDAIAAARAVEARGLTHTLDYVGESVRSLSEADQETRQYLHILERLAAADIGRNISLKLTQLGIDVDRATCTDNLRRILAPAERHNVFVRIDMESSTYTDVTLDIFETLWKQGSRNMGVVLQSALFRSDRDLERVIRLGGRIRLVKGAYKEPKTVAYQRKADVDAAFARLMRALLDRSEDPAIATHDPVLIQETQRYAADRGLAKDRFEFQMLYGVRRDLQSRLVAEGYRVRIYLPFGRHWFPYFMRRLGERPANVGFVLRNLLRKA